MRISLIGASGGLGSILADHLLLEGHSTDSWSRSGGRTVDVLDPRLPASAFETDRVIYLAWSTTDRSPEMQGWHAESAVRWAARAAAEGIPFLFISTVLAARGSVSEYGRAKLLAERGVVEQGGRNVRVGLVVDDGYPDLLATRLRRLAHRMPRVSSIGAWPVLPVSGRTAARMILEECLADTSDNAPLLAAERTTVRLAEIMSGDPDAPVSLSAAGLVTASVKRSPTSRGSIGRHLDALRGLALTPIDLDATRDAPSGPVRIGDWRSGISRAGSGHSEQ